MTSDTMRRYALAILAHIALIAAWYAFVTFGHVPAFVMPSPFATVSTLAGTNYAWVSNSLVTASEIFGGYFLAVLVGVTIAIVFSWSSTAEAAAMTGAEVAATWAAVTLLTGVTSLTALAAVTASSVTTLPV